MTFPLVFIALDGTSDGPPLTVHPVPSWAGRMPRLTSGYGPRSGGMYAIHKGADFMFPGEAGDPTNLPEGIVGARHWVMPSGRIAALASGDGVVTGAGWTNTGYHARIEHGGPWATGYMHLSRLAVRPGQKVKAGQMVGVIGYSPWKSGCMSKPGDPCKVGLNHLHWELYRHGVPVDPEVWLGPQLEKLEVRSNPLGWRTLLVAGGAVAVGIWAYRRYNSR